MRASALLAAAALAVALVAAPAAADLGGILHGFPAGLPQQENPMQQVPWIIPNLTSTQYRGTYVSGAMAGRGGWQLRARAL